MLTVSLSLQLSEDETDGRDGQASAVKMVAGETTLTGDKTMKEDNSMSARVNMCVQLRVCVDFCPCGSCVCHYQHVMSMQKEEKQHWNFYFYFVIS